jgi:hypothetical protein
MKQDVEHLRLDVRSFASSAQLSPLDIDLAFGKREDHKISRIPPAIEIVQAV